MVIHLTVKEQWQVIFQNHIFCLSTYQSQVLFQIKFRATVTTRILASENSE